MRMFRHNVTARWLFTASVVFSLAAAGLSFAAEPVVIQVDATSDRGPVTHPWSYFGYDESNYTTMPNAKKLLGELRAMSPAPVYIRTHFLLCNGDGKASLKWSSTNVYTEDAQGRPVYDWVILDRIFDSFRDTGVRPLVEIGFMPEALAVKPAKNVPSPMAGGKNYAGWNNPPKDYAKWRELVRQWVRHSVERYGKAEVESWLWELWNEPDIGYWGGTRAEFFKLYDYTADGLKSELPTAKIGGPETTGGGDRFLREFLDHCATGTNAATNKVGTPLDFISWHPKGSPKIEAGHVRMGVANQLRAIDRSMEVVAASPKFRNTPIILGESDPEGCAACPASTHPANAYRDGPLYGSYTAAATARTLELARKYRLNLQGIVTWSFEFENTPYFAGYRELATNGIDKPVLNVFRMLCKLDGKLIDCRSSGAVKLDEMITKGVRQNADVGAIASRGEGNVSVIVWNYHDDDVPAEDANIELEITGLPGDAAAVTVTHHRMDAHHSNAHAVWKEMGSPQKPSAEQYTKLEAAGQLEELEPKQTISAADGKLRLKFALPRQGVSLLSLTW